MRAIIDTTAHPGGGTMRYFKSIVPKLSEENEYIIITPKNRSGIFDLKAEQKQSSNITIHEVPFSYNNLIVRIVFQQVILPVLLYLWDADVLFSPGDVTAMLSPCPVVLMIHNPNPYYNSVGQFSLLSRIKFILLKALTWVSSKKANAIIFVSSHSRDVVTNALGISKNKSVVIHHGVDQKTFNSEINPDEDNYETKLEKYKPYILSVSTVQPHKNYEVLLRAFDSFLSESEEDFKLLIAGRRPSEDYYKQLMRLKNSLNNGNKIHFLGEVPEEQLRQLYQHAIIYVLPSKRETFGITVLEAMACRLPVIAANATSLPEVTGESAVLFDPENSHELTEALVKLIQNTSKRNKIAAGGQEWAQNFTWDRTAAQTEALLEKVSEEYE